MGGTWSGGNSGLPLHGSVSARLPSKAGDGLPHSAAISQPHNAANEILVTVLTTNCSGHQWILPASAMALGTTDNQ